MSLTRIDPPLLSYQIIASHSPTSYGANGLPAGLVVNSLTGNRGRLVTNGVNVTSQLVPSN